MSSASEKTGLPKILVVDDNKEMLMAMGAMLGASKFQVTTATSAAEALHLIDTKSFDVLLTDLHMPEAGDGYTVVSAMRHTNPRAVTLVFSGYPALRDAGSIDRINLERVIESLSPGYRITFVLHDVEGYEHNEIAEMLSCSIGTSKSQLHEARMILRDQLNITRSEYGRRRAPHTKTKVSAPAKRHPKAVATAA